MSILSGFKKVRRRIRLPDGYKLLSFWTSSQSVEMDDGTTLESNKTKWDDASNKKHEHANKSALDSITSEKVSKWNTIAESNVTGVKGNTESSYRTGNVNITCSDVGAVNKLGDTMIGDLGVPVACSTIDGSVPYCGSKASKVSQSYFSNYKTYLGTYTDVNDNWQNIISVRHRNGQGDGNCYGMYIRTGLLSTGNLVWNKQQRADYWQGERTILDNINCGSFVLPLTGGTLTGSVTAPTFVGNLQGNANAAGANIIYDTRNTNSTPAWYQATYPQKTITEFKFQTTIGLPKGVANEYCTLVTNIPWTDSSGGYPTQIAYVPASNRDIYVRYGLSGTTWSGWKKIVTDLSYWGSSVGIRNALDISTCVSKATELVIIVKGNLSFTFTIPVSILDTSMQNFVSGYQWSTSDYGSCHIQVSKTQALIYNLKIHGTQITDSSYSLRVYYR